MKINRKFAIYLFLLLFFSIYLLSANYIFNVLIRTDKESKLVDLILPPETQHVKFNIEQIKNVSLKWKEGLSIRGWVLKTKNPRVKRDAYLVLKSENSTLVFNVLNDSLPRPDIIEHFHFDKELRNKGFETVLPLYILKEDSYKIGFVLVDETGKYFSVSNLELRKISGDFNVVDLDAKPGSKVAESVPAPESLSHQVPLNIQKPTQEINYNFDSIHKSGKFLALRGWGFIDGLDTKALKKYILLKKNRKVVVFDVRLELRKDVTSHFNKTGLNLDSSGFQSIIPLGNMEEGSYQLGLYFSKGNQTGVVYTNRFFEIGK
jgi:hypothetical protein